MTSVCKWLGFYLCMKDSTLNEKIQTDSRWCDMVVSVKDTAKEKSGGLSFDLILQPAVVASPPAILRRSFPSMKSSLSQEEIEKKLCEANERRKSLEASKLQQLAKEKEHAAEVSMRLQQRNETFSRESEKKLTEKMEAFAENRNAQVNALRERLQDHALRVDEVRKFSDQCRSELKERIDRKLETAEEKRDAQLTSIQDRIRKHQKHIEEVIDQSSKFSKDTEDKILQKMEASIKNRDDQINHLLDRLKDHERRVQQVRQNKAVRSSYQEDENKDDEGVETGPGDAYEEESESGGEEDLSSPPESSPSAVDLTEFHLADLPPTETSLPVCSDVLDASGFHDYSDMDGFEFVKVELTHQDDKIPTDSVADDDMSGLNPDPSTNTTLDEREDIEKQSTNDSCSPQLEEIDVFIRNENNSASLEIPIEGASSAGIDSSAVGESLSLVG